MMRTLGKFAATACLGACFSLPCNAQQTQTQVAAAGAAALTTAQAAPFVLSPQEQAALDQFLQAWETQSTGTKRLEATFRRWHYDPLAAPPGIHATWAEGSLKYAAPDKGLFKVNTLKFFNGIVEGKATYTENPGQFGEHWVCDGERLLEFDHSRKECKIQQLPPELRGKEILESPLPFVFNLNAAKIKERYWLRQAQPEAGLVVVEAHPKYQSDRAQYKYVRIVINTSTFLPQALILFGPNYHEQTAPAYDHYEFKNVERNTITQSLAAWSRVFIDERPPSDWRVIEGVFRPDPQPQIAQPGEQSTRR